MLISRLVSSVLLPALLSRGLLAVALPAKRATPDPCAKIAGLSFVDPADAIACQKSFKFDERLRKNVMSVVSRVFDFFTFEDFYLNSPPPFQESTKDIRAEIARISSTQYATDYDFNMDLYDFTNQLNDGHTSWFPFCYMTYSNILPTPIVLLDKGVFIAPDADVLFGSPGTGFSDYFEAKGFDWRPLAGAKVLEIGGVPARDYIDTVARTASGNFLDHNIRVNSVVSSYQMPFGRLTQRLGDLAASPVLRQTSLQFTLIPVDSPSGPPEYIDVPFVAVLNGLPFKGRASYWQNNCVATNETNGIDWRTADDTPRPFAYAGLLNPTAGTDPDLPSPFLPTAAESDGSNSIMKTFILPGSKTGVMFIGTFEGDSNQFYFDVAAAAKRFKAAGVENILIDVTDNGGGFVCLGLFLHEFLAGSKIGLPGFQSTSRANPLAQEIVRANIAQGLNGTFYSPSSWLFLNGTQMPIDFNYNDPSLPYVINGRQDPTSQRFADSCPDPPVTIPADPPFDLDKIVIVGNGFCASTCALFTTVMYERHQTKIVTFGGHPDMPIEYKGMAGNQVLPFSVLDSEIKTAGLKDDPLAPPDLLVNADMRHNWRSAYSFKNENLPIAYRSEPSQYRFPYTEDTYNNPQNLWSFVEQEFFP